MIAVLDVPPVDLSVPGDWSRPPEFDFDRDEPPLGVTLPSEAHLLMLESERADRTR
jgi:hypothetical protein